MGGQAALVAARGAVAGLTAPSRPSDDSAPTAARTRFRRSLPFVAIGSVGMFALIEIAGLRLIDRAAEQDALAQAGVITADLARVTFDPYLTAELLAGDPDALARLDSASAELLEHGQVDHLKIWTADGRVVWSDQHELIERRFELDEPELALFDTLEASVGVSDLSSEENQLEAADGDERSLEVYVPAVADDGTPVLVETYSPYELVATRADALRRRFVPPLTIVLVVLAVGQVALFWAVGRRLGAEERRRRHLLERLIQTSDAERRRVAAEVHDGVVQDLMGISFALAGAAQAATAQRDELTELSGSTRSAVSQLRALLTSIYPTDVPAGGWLEALDDIFDQMRARGMRVEVDVRSAEITPVEEIVVLRIAREALRNVQRHADAATVTVRLTVDSRRLRLTIADDGVGFDAGVRPQEHFGLRLMEDLAIDAGGVLHITTGERGGTTVRFEMGRSR